MTKIKIHGEKELFPIDDVRDSVVKISQTYYWRHSNVITKVNGRFYRKESPLIIKNYKGDFILRANAVTLAPGVYAAPEDKNLVQLVDGGWTSRDMVIEVEKKFYLSGDSRLIKDALSRDFFILKETAVKLVEEFYGKESYTRADRDELVKLPEGYAIESDLLPYINENGKMAKMHRGLISKLINDRKIIKVFWKFQNPNFPHPEHTLAIYAHVKNHVNLVHTDLLPFSVLDKDLKYVNKAIEFYRSLNLRDDREAIRKRLNSFYDEAGPDENTAKEFGLNYETFRGGHVITNGRGQLQLSSKFAMTGGIKYTFGIEIETSAGLLSPETCQKLGISIVADSSIGAGEYLTPPMHGDVGVKKLKAIMTELHKHTLVDNRNAVHIHIGGAEDPTGKNRAQAPVFNTEFGIGAIKLATQLEDELFAAMPPYRQPEIKYCSGLKKFAGINHENYKNYLGAFVFGPEVEQLKQSDIVKGKYAINSQRNHNTPLDRWCKGRYKWLNMVNAFASGRFKTIEFRIFGATTRFEKVYNYLLTSLAFVWFVENRLNLIHKGGVTLDMMFDEAFDEAMATELKTFYAERKKRFADARAKVQQLNNNN